MSNQVSISVKELTVIKTPTTNDFSSYRDLQRLPITKSNFKRTYLKGASHRVKSLKEENQFAEGHRRQGNEKLFKFKRQDQLLNIRNMHLHKLTPLNTEPYIDENNKFQNKQTISNEEQTNPNLRLIKNSSNQILSLVYNPQPIIKKQVRYPLQNLSQKTEFQNSLLVTQVTHSGLNSPKESYKKKIELSIMKPQNKKSQKDIFIDSIQTTSYGSIRMDTIETKYISPKANIPTSLDSTKKLLKQYL
ncbi:unnamed protein product [Paramecium sonneborni]|uniref:Uncharacterized protein n=1 Tax=Paramecium sonneborni TaxID=65129 RepID=A0A8S1L5E9_9CILI|nr:unnamed protein product [Paramecium sonneborni]